MGKINGSYKEHLINKIEDLKSGEYVILSENFSYKDTVDMLHTKCNTIFNPSIKNFTSKKGKNGKGTRCPKCSHQSYTYDISDVTNYLQKVTLGEYELLDKEYKNNKEKLKFRHNYLFCKNHEFEMTWNDFKNGGQRCPECNRLTRVSKQHKYIRNFFLKYNIKFEEEKTFDTCKNKKLLRFDFFLPKYNLLLEYDGEQHRKEFSGDKEALKNQKINDEIKNNWVLENKEYSLMRLNSRNMETLADIMFNYFIDEDSTTIERYNKNIKFISSRVPSSDGEMEASNH